MASHQSDITLVYSFLFHGFTCITLIHCVLCDKYYYEIISLYLMTALKNSINK